MVGTLITIATIGIVGTVVEKVLNEMGQGNIADYVRVTKSCSCAGLALAQVFSLFSQIGLI